MAAIVGTPLSPRSEALILVATVLALMTTVIVPVSYVVAVPAVCLGAAAVAPGGRRVLAAMAAWLPVSLAAVATIAVG